MARRGGSAFSAKNTALIMKSMYRTYWNHAVTSGLGAIQATASWAGQWRLEPMDDAVALALATRLRMSAKSELGKLVTAGHLSEEELNDVCACPVTFESLL